jgi:DNA-directed RNA polymerase subunit RPC12/RpoP
MSIKKDFENFANRVTKPKPIICKKCGHKIGFVRPKIKFNRKIITYIFILALITEIIAQLVSDLLFKLLGV